MSEANQHVIVEPPDPGWADAFQREAKLVMETLASVAVAIHHAGSTSVPGLHAKPVIDMVLEVTSLDELDARNAAMEALGYEVRGEFGIPGRRYFSKRNEAGDRGYHIHSFVIESPDAERILAFRDYLRAHPETAQQYAELKCRLAREHPRDIQSYMDGKDRFVKEVERAALIWSRERR